jgi:cytochrome c2
MHLVLSLTFILAAGPALAATGEDAFNDACADCHTIDAASNPTAPSLKGVVGRKIASLTDFQYSAALTLKAKAGWAWTDANLNAFLADPKGFAPGTTMFGGAPEAAQRQAIIAYLKTAK